MDAEAQERRVADGAGEPALIHDVQWDYLGQDVLHVDFARVAADEKIHLEVRVELRGTAPGVAKGGNVVQPLHSLHIECLATNIPESIRVSIAEMQIDDAIHVKELKLPEGVVVENDPDAIVVQCLKAKEEVAATPPAAESAEPEVIGKVKEEEERRLIAVQHLVIGTDRDGRVHFVSDDGVLCTNIRGAAVFTRMGFEQAQAIASKPDLEQRRTCAQLAVISITAGDLERLMGEIALNESLPPSR